MAATFLISFLFSFLAFGQLTEVQRAELNSRNLLEDSNPGFENGHSKWLFVPDGASSVSFITSGVERGKRSAKIDVDYGGPILFSSQQIEIPESLRGKDCEAAVVLKREDEDEYVSSAPNDKVFTVYDGTSVVASKNIDAQYDTWTEVKIQFTCPESGTLGLRFSIENSHSGGPYFWIHYFLDSAYLGPRRTLPPTSSGEGFGSLTYAGTADCTWSTTSGTYANFAADNDCPTPTTSGNATAPSTKIPGAVFLNIPAGKYQVVVAAEFRADYSSSNTHCSWAISDGSDRSGVIRTTATTGVPARLGVAVGIFEYSTFQTSKTIQVQSIRISGGGTCNINNDASGVNEFKITLIPLGVRYGNDNGEVVGRVSRNAAQTGINPNNSSVKLTYTTVDSDPYALWNAANNRWVIKEAGCYVFSGSTHLAATNTLDAAYFSQIFIDGSLHSVINGIWNTSPGILTFLFGGSSGPICLNAGQYAEMYLYGSGNNSSNQLATNTAAALNYFSIHRVSPSGITNTMSLTKAADNQFTSGNILITRTGNQVCLTWTNLGYSSSSELRITSTGFLPSWARPTIGHARTLHTFSNAEIFRAVATTDGIFSSTALNYSGGNATTSSSPGGTLCYGVQ